MDEDFDTRVQKEAEAHLDGCFDATDELGNSPAIAPFCGCTTCIVREVLTVCWDAMTEEVEKRAAAQRAGALTQLRRDGDAVRAVSRPGEY